MNPTLGGEGIHRQSVLPQRELKPDIMAGRDAERRKRDTHFTDGPVFGSNSNLFVVHLQMKRESLARIARALYIQTHFRAFQIAKAVLHEIEAEEKIL